MAVIWEDYFVSLSGSSASLTITHSGETIYTGVAVKKPGASSIEVKINDICAPYLGHSLLAMSGTTYEPNYESFGVNSSSVSFYADWSYDGSGTPLGHAPIFKRRQTNQNVPTTSAGYTSMSSSPSGWTTQDSCHPYALYYVNAYGGWDTLLLEGKCRRTDKYARAVFQPDYDNSSDVVGRVNYRTDIKRTWEVWTGWLTDDEASRMHHLFGTCMAEICELSTQKAYPVMVTNSDCPFKRNKDGKVAFGITLEETRDYTRR